jgi:hypothetical protein
MVAGLREMTLWCRTICGRLYSKFPDASLWLSWEKWVASLSAFAASRKATDQPPEELFQLLLRIGHRNEETASTVSGALGASRDVDSLRDLRLWLKIVRAACVPTGSSVTCVQALLRPCMWAWGTRPVALQTGHLGYAPEDADAADDVVVFRGIKAELVVRKVNDSERRIIGPAFVCGAMQGQYLRSSSVSQTYTLV